jgi:hypothetical protein
MVNMPARMGNTGSARSGAVTALLTIVLLATVRCSSSNSSPTPTPPSTSPANVGSVALNPATVVPGATSQGTVTLTTSAGATVTLSSSNTSVATVSASLTVAAGATTGSFTITAVAGGLSTITASANGTSVTATITVTAAPIQALGLTLSAPTVVGGNPVTGTVILSAAAPSGGTVVNLSSNDPVTVPASVTVAAGQTIASFTVNTRAVGGAFNNVPITATTGTLSAQATLTVTPIAPTAPVARFGVSGPSGINTCKLINGGNTFDCQFDGSASTPSPGATLNLWTWSYTVAGTTTETSSSPILTPSPGCTLVPPASSAPPGATFLQMTVTLTVRDSAGLTSPGLTNVNVRVLPNMNCGYAF